MGERLNLGFKEDGTRADCGLAGASGHTRFVARHWRGRLRLASRCLALAAAVALACPLLAGSPSEVLLPALSPFVGVLSAVALRAVRVLTAACLPVLLLALVSRRWFCHYACPVGLLQDLLARLRLLSGRWLRRVPRLGYGAVLFTLGGACLGYPLFLWLDPLALLAAFVSALRQPANGAAWAAGAGLPFVLLLGLLLPNVWCARVCPLGATQDLLAAITRLMRRLTVSLGVPSTSKLTVEPAATLRLQRRAALAAGLGACAALVCTRTARGAPLPLRPPGAAEEESIGGVCVRCGNCVRACPAKIIQPDLGQYGLAGLLVPLLRFDSDYCHENCHACNTVCPSGAIARLPLGEKRRRAIGLAQVDTALCFMANGQDCTVCISQCPYEAVARQDSDDGFSSSPAVDRAKCTGCGACEFACPTRPVRAIRVIRLRKIPTR